MNKVIPILPCPDIKAQAEFYQHLGFEIKAIYTSPNPYVVVVLGDIELHFYGSRKFVPERNSSMCYIRVDDVDGLCENFTRSLKANLNKVPRSGLPRITKVRDLSLDRRFTLTDAGGNTFYIGTPVTEEAARFFRTLESEGHAKKFAVLYDVLFSKEDPKMAAGMLPQFESIRPELASLDLAKLLLVELEMKKQLGDTVQDGELKSLMEAYPESEDWDRIRQRHAALFKED